MNENPVTSEDAVAGGENKAFDRFLALSSRMLSDGSSYYRELVEIFRAMEASAIVELTSAATTETIWKAQGKVLALQKLRYHLVDVEKILRVRQGRRQ